MFNVQNGAVMSLFRLVKYIVIIFSLILFTGCPDDNPVTPAKSQISEETVIEKKEVNVTSSGLSVKMSDGSEVIVPEDAVSSETKLTVSRIKNDTYFPDENHASLDINSVNSISNITVTIKVPAGPRYCSLIERYCAIIGVVSAMRAELP